MKSTSRICLAMFVVLIGITSNFVAQSTKNSIAEIENGYYGLKWGCTQAEFKAKYPNAQYQGKNNTDDDIYYISSDENTRVFSFYEDKMRFCRIAYMDVSADKSMAIIQKLVDTYGKIDKTSKGSDDGNEYFSFYIHLDKITIDITSTDYYNGYGRQAGNSLMVTYANNKLSEDAAKSRQNKMKKELEL